MCPPCLCCIGPGVPGGCGEASVLRLRNRKRPARWAPEPFTGLQRQGEGPCSRYEKNSYFARGKVGGRGVELGGGLGCGSRVRARDPPLLVIPRSKALTCHSEEQSPYLSFRGAKPLLVIPRSKAMRNLRSQPHHNARTPHSPPRATRLYPQHPSIPYHSPMPTHRTRPTTTVVPAPQSSFLRRQEPRYLPPRRRGNLDRAPIPSSFLRRQSLPPRRRGNLDVVDAWSREGYPAQPDHRLTPCLELVSHPPFSTPVSYLEVVPRLFHAALVSYLRRAVPTPACETTAKLDPLSDGRTKRRVQAGAAQATEQPRNNLKAVSAHRRATPGTEGPGKNARNETNRLEAGEGGA